MTRTLRAAACVLAAALAGCGGGAGSQLAHTRAGSFLMIEGSVNDIVSTIMSPTYRSRSRDLGTDSDRVGLALLTFLKETEGTALAADAAELQTRFDALEKAASSRAPVDKQREAARALQAAVEAVKAKL